jgi:hypothetical protein
MQVMPHGSGICNSWLMRTGAALVEVRASKFCGTWPDQVRSPDRRCSPAGHGT